MIKTTQEESKGNLSTPDLDAAVSIGYKSDLPDDEPIKMPLADDEVIWRMMKKSQTSLTENVVEHLRFL
jgi:hypothetical protein